ncbi:phage tail sheath family protein [Methylovulum miyakonense]|uniref:phage tail sheath family protein n=1 Tax=Methylovulum miyakonense TaxID=645578 RepID=UPI00036752A9|nr:phage tail sheath C-terminal domain-containing protein [Methylovulum miyakonense]
MATSYKTPGVYIEEIPKFPPSIAPVETAIPAFIGYTAKAQEKDANDLNLKPKRIASLVEYEKYFGGPQPETKIVVSITESQDANGNTQLVTSAALADADRSKHIMYYALQMFFANGGGPCHIVSVGAYKALGTALVEKELEAGLDALVKADEPTLIVFPEAQFLHGIADFKALHDLALAQCEKLKDRFVIMDVHGDDLSLSDADANLLDVVGNFRDDGIGANNLKYGAAYAPNLETVLDYTVVEAQIDVSFNGANAVKLNTLQETQNNRYELAKAAIRELPCILPPSSTMAGIYAAVDNSRGVWKAPANVSVNAVIKPTIEFSNVEQDQMNVDPTAGKSVNAIRPFIGKGTLVWGARTLAGNDNEWRYVNVRRFFIFAEESIKKATGQFVFEPNDANTWVRVQAMIENFLSVQWRQGALQGIKPEHAFYVAVGLGKTMTPLDILEGRMVIEIGMAVVRPAEFIILRFSHKMAES